MEPVSCAQPRRRVQIDCSGPGLTDQSFKKMCDINQIVATYQKTGMFPNFKAREPRYVDNTQVRPFLEAFDIVKEAKALFMELPAVVRKAMDNNPANFETFIRDEKNTEFLFQHGVLVPVMEKVKESAFTKEDLEFLREAKKEGPTK